MKYILSQKQKDAVKAVLRAMKETLPKRDAVKIGENRYSGYEIAIFTLKSRKGDAEYTFSVKGGVWAKKWRRSWNSIPTLEEVKTSTRGEYQNHIDSIQKRVNDKTKKVKDERFRLSSVAMERFHDALEKAKLSSKQTKNVKELLAVEGLLEKKLTAQLKELYVNSYLDTSSLKLFKNAFLSKQGVTHVKFCQIDANVLDGDYRKECVDMRPSAWSDFYNSFNCCGSDKRTEELREKAEKVTEKDSRWYSIFKAESNRIRSIFSADAFPLSFLRTDVEGIDTYEPNRNDGIHTLVISINEVGGENVQFDSYSNNESWDYIPKGYEIMSSGSFDFLMGWATNKTRSFMTDTRKLKTLEIDVKKEEKAISKLIDKMMMV